MELTAVDYSILCGIALVAGIGLWRGLSGEIGFIAGLVAAIATGFMAYGAARELAVACGLAKGGALDAPAAGAIDFVFALVAFGVVRFVVAKFVSVLVPQPTNAIIGGICGIIKGTVGVCLLAGIGILPPGRYSQGFLSGHSVIVRLVATFADGYFGESDGGNCS